MMNIHMALWRRTVVGFLFAILVVTRIDAAVDEPVGVAMDLKQNEDRKIKPRDTIIILVWQEEDLSGEFRVQSSGKVNFTFLGEVPVEGKTESEVAAQIKRLLGQDYLVRPEVTVMVKEFVFRTVNVGGEVNKPGKIEIPGQEEWSVLDAIAAAGDFTRQAKRGDIELIRDGKTHKYSLDELIKLDADPATKVVIRAGDYIKVGQRWL